MWIHLLTQKLIKGASTVAVPFPPANIPYEILHPIPPQGHTNNLVHFMDSGKPKVTKKSSSIWRHETCTLQFRVQANYLSAFLEPIISGKNGKFIITFPNIRPFLRLDDTDIVVRIPYFTEPVRENYEMYSFSITFLYDPNFNTITL